jgi:uncharacterized membrane protein YidH (DUF202 family)
MEITSNQLAMQRTKFANQRTYLAFFRTGLGIAALAGALQKTWIGIIGFALIILSSIQYLAIDNDLKKKKLPNYNYIPFIIPFIFIILYISALYPSTFKGKAY